MIGSARSWFGAAALTSGVLLLLAGYAAYAFRDLPDPRNVSAMAQSIVIYDRTGQMLATRDSSGQLHIEQKLSQLGRLGPEATLAAEDRDFYRHGPLETTALVRAGVTDLVSRQAAQGGSTITQQLVKIMVLRPQKTLGRKGQEALLAWAMERRYSKDQILEMYLNRVYYGHRAYGLAAASKTYFGSDKEPKDLTPAQAAFLAGLLQAPSTFDPLSNYSGARNRELYVLGGMRSMGLLSQAQYAAAAAEDVQKELKFDAGVINARAPHFVDYVMQRLESDYGAAAVQRGGFSVYTSIDPALQALAEQSVQSGVKSLAGLGVNNAAMLAVSPTTGKILAWVGSADYGNAAIGGQFNVVTSPRQPGSSFKPYVYEAALREHKIALCSQLNDSATNFSGYRPLDFDNRYMGRLTAAEALVLSRNVPAVQVASLEGIQNVIQLANSMGIHSPLDPSLPTAIGASGVTMLEHAQGYQVFAAQGRKMPLIGITKVVDSSGQVLYNQQPGQQPGQVQVLSPAEAYLITDTLKAYQTQWGLGWNRQMASKSGTSGGSQTGVNPDSWMMAYNPNIVVAAWAGNTGANGAGAATRSYGVNVGSTISASFINGLPNGFNQWYSQPAGLAQGRGGTLELPGTDALCSGPQGGSSGEGQGGNRGGPPAQKKKH